MAELTVAYPGVQWNKEGSLEKEVDMAPQRGRDEGVSEKGLGHGLESSHGIFELQEPFEVCSHFFLLQVRGLTDWEGK